MGWKPLEMQAASGWSGQLEVLIPLPLPESRPPQSPLDQGDGFLTGLFYSSLHNPFPSSTKVVF